MNGDLRATARIDGRVERVASKADAIREVVSMAIGEIGGQGGVVVEIVMAVGYCL